MLRWIYLVEKWIVKRMSTKPQTTSSPLGITAAMATLPGLKRQRKVNASGLAEYWYVRKTGQPILTAHGKTELLLERDVKSKIEAALRLYWTGDTTPKKTFRARTIHDLITLYLKDPTFLKKKKGKGNRGPRTLHDLREDFDAIRESKVAKMPLVALTRQREAKKVITEWRNYYAETPKTADKLMAALNEVLNWGASSGQPEYEVNPLGEWDHLYAPKSRATIIMPPKDIEMVGGFAKTDLRDAIHFSAFSGVRAGDLLEVSWLDLTDDGREIRIKPKKGESHLRVVRLPVIPELRALLDKMPRAEDWATRAWNPPLKEGETEKDRRFDLPWPILTREGKPWARGTLENQWKDARKAAIAAGQTQFIGKRWHDLRGTYGTRLARNPMITLNDLQEIMGWDERTAKFVVKFYVDDAVRNDALLDRIVSGEAEMIARAVARKAEGS
jgi:integrase